MEVDFCFSWVVQAQWSEIWSPRSCSAISQMVGSDDLSVMWLQWRWSLVPLKLLQYLLGGDTHICVMWSQNMKFCSLEVGFNLSWVEIVFWCCAGTENDILSVLKLSIRLVATAKPLLSRKTPVFRVHCQLMPLHSGVALSRKGSILSLHSC